MCSAWLKARIISEKALTASKLVKEPNWCSQGLLKSLTIHKSKLWYTLLWKACADKVCPTYQNISRRSEELVTPKGCTWHSKMSKKLLTRSFPKTVKGYRIEVPTHHQKEETDICSLRMIFDMLYKSIPNHTKGPKIIANAENHCTHKYPSN